MGGYFIYSLDGIAFRELTSSPTTTQASAIAEFTQSEYADFLKNSKSWPDGGDALTVRIKRCLASDDWYADSADGDPFDMDLIVSSMLDDGVQEKLEIGFECLQYDSIYWDCAEMAASKGADMMQESRFGSSGFRCADAQKSIAREYSIFTPEQTLELHRQLKKVEPHFSSLRDDGESGIRQQFFRDLLEPVRRTAEDARYLFVTTDT